MPTVPTEQNRVGIADLTDAKLQPGDYSGTGLQALGAGMQQLGGVGAKIAGDVQRRQDADDDFEIKKAWNAYAEGARSIRADAMGKFDADPQGMLTQVTQDYGGLRDWIRSGLKNDRQRNQFDRVIAERFDYDLSGALTDSEQALRRGQDRQGLLLEQNAADDAVANPDDPALFDKHLHTGTESIAGRAAARGDDPATIEQSVTAYRSGIQRRVLQDMIERDPVAAANRYRAMRDGMTATDRQTAQKELFEPLARALGTQDVDGLLPPPELEGPAPLSPEQRASVAEAIEAQPWTDVRKYYAREDLATRGSLEDRQRKQAADAAKDKGLAIAEQFGPDFTSVAQLPPEVRRDLDDDTAQTLGLMAQDNLDGRQVAPNGVTSLMMNLIASENPDAFAKEDLRLVRGKVTPAEYERFIRLKQGLNDFASDAGIINQRRLIGTLVSRSFQISSIPGLKYLNNVNYIGPPQPISDDQPGRTSVAADIGPEGETSDDRTITERHKRDSPNKHGITWHINNILAGRNWDGTQNRVFNSRSEAAILEQRGIDKAMSTPLSPDYITTNPGFSFLDYPEKNTKVYRWHLNGKGIAAGVLDLTAILPWGRSAGFLKAELNAADKAAANLVPRLGQKGVDAARHNANVLIRDASGKIVTHQRFVSGSMTAEEKALGFPKDMLATHTEARAVRGLDLRQGDNVSITGQLPPCIPCRAAMNRAATETGATIKYQWRQGGKTITWTATPKRTKRK